MLWFGTNCTLRPNSTDPTDLAKGETSTCQLGHAVVASHYQLRTRFVVGVFSFYLRLSVFPFLLYCFFFSWSTQRINHTFLCNFPQTSPPPTPYFIGIKRELEDAGSLVLTKCQATWWWRLRRHDNRFQSTTNYGGKLDFVTDHFQKE